MKKIIVTILALVYISTSTGVMLRMHYCMDKLADWGLSYNKSKRCDKCGMEKTDKKNNGCCKDDQKFIKNDIDQKTTESAYQLIQLMAVTLTVSFAEITTIHLPSVTEKYPISHAPPRSSDIAFYIRNCVFLI